MFRTLIAAVFALVALQAQADPTVQLDYDHKIRQHANGETHDLLGLSIDQTVFQQFTVGIHMENEWIDQHEYDQSASLVQLQGSYHLPKLGPIESSVMATLGERFEPGNRFGFYSVGAEARVPVWRQLNLVGAARWRAPFDRNNEFQTMEYSAGLEYTLTKNLGLGARYKIERGDYDFNSVNLNVSYKF